MAAQRLQTLLGQLQPTSQQPLLPQPVNATSALEIAASRAGVSSPTGRSYPAGTSISLMGNMEPVMQETAGQLELVEGALPAELEGFFLRTGPNPGEALFGEKRYHEFSGDGMLHSVELKGGKAFYCNRFVDTELRRKEKEKGRALNQMEKMKGDGTLAGAANTALLWYKKQLMALFEVDKPYVLSVPGLETQGQEGLGGGLQHNMTAHPKVCPKTGELIYFGYDLMAPVVRYGVADKEGKVLTSLEVPTQGKRPVMMHDMAITENFSILLEFPLYFEMSRAASGMPFVHDSSLPSSFAVLPRHAKDLKEVRWFKGETAMAFHIANAWEEGNSIKLVGCPASRFSFDYGESTSSRFWEWTFDLKTGSTSERQLDDAHVEFPVVHPKTTGRKSKFVWAAVFAGPGAPFHSIKGCTKLDLSTGESKRHEFKGKRWGGESVFAPKPGATEEDEGWLLTYTYNAEEMCTELYVLDAKSMGPEPVAILKTPQRVPFGFHGLWLPREECA